MPLLRNVEHLLLDEGIARLFGALFALSRLGAVFVCLGCQDRSPRLNATPANPAGGGPAGFKARQELGVGEGACLPSLTFPVSLHRDETGATAVNPLGELH